MSIEEVSFWRMNNPVLWGLILTIVLAMVVFILAINNGPNGVPRLREFINLPSNAVGDTLAGIFAPLALIWIVVTVFLQSQELAEQRKELKLTRAELRLAREAQEKQLEVMQRQADIFDDEKKQREELRADALLREHLDGTISFFKQNIDCHYTCLWFFDLHDFMKKNYSSGAEQLKDQARLEREIALHSSVDTFYPYFSKKFSRQLQVYKNLLEQNSLAKEFRDFVEEIRMRVQRSLSLTHLVSDAQRVRMETLRLLDFVEAIDELNWILDPVEEPNKATKT